MYSYTYDPTTGGLLLNTTPTNLSKEPRAVYAPELDLLGFDKFWTYDKQTERPYLWAEANYYYYRGTLVAKLQGGSEFTAPEILLQYHDDGTPVTPEPGNAPLRPVDLDAMVRANRERLDVIEQTTVKKIYAVYTKYKNKLDAFHVAFSGGKDSCVLLELVKKALPKGSFIVIFGDTGMEFPDTYDTVQKIKAQCDAQNIPFYTAKSHLTPQESWNLFGPPSRTLRWCCSVHKSTPQTLKLREITGKNDYTGLAFVGVRAQESYARSLYEYENNGKKIKGQFSHNPILEWTSAEIWIYIYAHHITINTAYKKGSARVGCLCCPMGGGRACYIEHQNYPNEVNAFHNIIRQSYQNSDIKDINDYIDKNGWSARKNGRDINHFTSQYIEENTNNSTSITTSELPTPWNEWIKTISHLDIDYSIKKQKNAFTITVSPKTEEHDNALTNRLFKQVARKAVFCKGCRVCEANCSNGSLHFTNNGIQISNCIHCLKCHDIVSGCLLFKSLYSQTKSETKMQKKKTLNTFSNHAPKTEWISSFFQLKEHYFEHHELNTKNQLPRFCTFLADSGLIDKSKKLTPLVDILETLKWSGCTSQGIMLINLANRNPQIEWYILNFNLNRAYSVDTCVEMLINSGIELSKNGKHETHDSIIYAFKRLVQTPLGTSLHFGTVTSEGALMRTPCVVTDLRVFLYGLFVFAEKSGARNFSLSWLMDEVPDREGISPTRIFGTPREEATQLLRGLSINYPGFIHASFTHDLETIALADEKSSQDVLNLFKEEN